MSSRPQLRLQMDPDERLAAAAGGAARYYADSAGLDNEAILQWQSAVVAACKHCFHCHSTATSCQITLRRLDNRIEIELALPGKEPPPMQDNPSWPGVDEVQCEAHANEAVLRLTKFVPPAPAD